MSIASAKKSLLQLAPYEKFTVDRKLSLLLLSAVATTVLFSASSLSLFVFLYVCFFSVTAIIHELLHLELMKFWRKKCFDNRKNLTEFQGQAKDQGHGTEFSYW